MSKRFQPTPEQLVLSKQRKAKKAKLSENPAPPTVVEAKGSILARKWVQLPVTRDLDVGRRVKVMTWNVSAFRYSHNAISDRYIYSYLHNVLFVSRVYFLLNDFRRGYLGRELFPNSDCLKAAQREHMLYNEILSSAADIVCLQEVDRLEKLLPVIEGAGYSHTYAAGPGKKHGCLIAYNKDKFTKVKERVVHYDDEEIRTDGDDRIRRGCSFRTKNIGSLLALKRNDTESNGIIVATTHLFWHPKYALVFLLDNSRDSQSLGTHMREQG